MNFVLSKHLRDYYRENNNLHPRVWAPPVRNRHLTRVVLPGVCRKGVSSSLGRRLLSPSHQRLLFSNKNVSFSCADERYLECLIAFAVSGITFGKKWKHVFLLAINGFLRVNLLFLIDFVCEMRKGCINLEVMFDQG